LCTIKTKGWRKIIIPRIMLAGDNVQKQQLQRNKTV
jgi:hypothetical protein